jgi:hypothetical protein
MGRVIKKNNEASSSSFSESFYFKIIQNESNELSELNK